MPVLRVRRIAACQCDCHGVLGDPGVRRQQKAMLFEAAVEAAGDVLRLLRFWRYSGPSTSIYQLVCGAVLALAVQPVPADDHSDHHRPVALQGCHIGLVVRPRPNSA